MAALKRKKIIWAVDPYGDVKIQASAAAFARSLSDSTDVEVVYIHGRSDFPKKYEREEIRFGLSSAEKQLKQTLTKLKFKPGKHPKILAHGSQFVRSDVKTLVSYAKKIKADAVLVSTNARAGFVRQVLGSFSETLILESAIPTMIVNPLAKVALRPGTILFPTDFSKPSWKAYQRVVDFAKTSGGKIEIFHQYQGKAQSVTGDVSYFREGLWLEGERLLDDELQAVRSNLSKWLSWTRKQNVECDHVIEFGLRNIADATTEQAKKDNVWMIAMATLTGPISARFLGSNARRLVRSASCPVWVLYVEEK